MVIKNLKISTVAFASLLVSSSLLAAPFKPVVKLSSGEELQVEPRPTVKVGNEYNIQGVTYKPLEVENYDVVGLASWYGDDFQGKLTANGEVFDMEELTAAHNTLQLPSIVEVTNLENGKKIIVRINDRGPFSGGRTIDLSKRAAELLGFKEKGTAQVRVTLLKEISEQAAKAITPASFNKANKVAKEDVKIDNATVTDLAKEDVKIDNATVTDLAKEGVKVDNAVVTDLAKEDVKVIDTNNIPANEVNDLTNSAATSNAKVISTSGPENVENIEPNTKISDLGGYANSEKKNEVLLSENSVANVSSKEGEGENVVLNEKNDILMSGSNQAMKPISLIEPKAVKSYVPRGVFVQIGAFSNENSQVRKDVGSLSDIGVVSLQKVDIDGKDILRLRVGPYGSIDDALKIKNRLVKLGYSDSRVIIEQ